MLRIHRSENREVVFTLSGQPDEESIAELETLINSEANRRRIALDLKDLTLVNEDAQTACCRRAVEDPFDTHCYIAVSVAHRYENRGARLRCLLRCRLLLVQGDQRVDSGHQPGRDAAPRRLSARHATAARKRPAPAS
jgi:hypothetical protein